jgi:hypothetical protein
VVRSLAGVVGNGHGPESLASDKLMGSVANELHPTLACAEQAT